MKNPFHITGPALLSCSGGRTSAYMLWKVLEAHGGTLPKDVYPVFANTGKELPATLDFVRDCATHWNAPLRWLEYVPMMGGTRVGYREVTHATAARQGEPFATMMDHERFVPNPSKRICTKNLKVLTMQAFAWDVFALAPGDYVEVIGIRADEAHRILNLRAEWPERVLESPLVAAGVSKTDVLAWWKEQPFDLQLGPHESNCDLCYLKGIATRVAIMQRRPELSAWWIEQEQARGHRFHKNGPSYASLVKFAASQERLPIVYDDEHVLEGCGCTD